MKILFIHRSVGNNLIQDGGVYELMRDHDNILLSDLNQNTGILRDQTGKRSTDMQMPGNNTRPEDYAQLFSDDYSSTLKTFVMNFDMVVIKSCYPNSNIKTDEELKLIQQYYKSIADFFLKSRRQLLIFTSPPLRPTSTTPDNAARARELANWLNKQDFGKRVKAFDLFDLLAEQDNMLKKEFRRLVWLDNHPNKRASMEIAPRLVSQIVRKV